LKFAELKFFFNKNENLMETKLKTNIKCAGCIAKVTPFLNENTAIQSWEVDIQNPDKVLTIKGNITKEEITNIVQKAGFKVL
jgi:copper chaperone